MPCHLTKNCLSGRPSRGLGGGALGSASGGRGGGGPTGGWPHFQIKIFCTFPFKAGHWKVKQSLLHQRVCTLTHKHWGVETYRVTVLFLSYSFTTETEFAFELGSFHHLISSISFEVSPACLFFFLGLANHKLNSVSQFSCLPGATPIQKFYLKYRNC